MNQKFNQIKNVKGEIFLKGDKSISHRALLFSAMASGESKIENLSDSLDVQATINCLKQLGAEVYSSDDYTIIKGVSERGFKKPGANLNCFNSGTTARLISGILVAQSFECVVIGDQSLSKRPMKRIIEPLQLMGGKIESTEKGTLPLIIRPTDGLKAVNYELNIPSAQVKSAILIAGLHCESETTVIEKTITRDHTERLLGLNVTRSFDKLITSSSKRNYPSAKEYYIPGDISSAAFLIVLALLTKKSELIVRNISLNPTRTAFIEHLKKMGAKIVILKQETSNNEEHGDLLVKYSELKNIPVNQDIIPSIIDEIPVLAIAGIFAEGKFEIRNCGELRFKESDRIKSICSNLINAGMEVVEFDDGFLTEGKLKNSEIVLDSYNDHRIAMAFSILSMLNQKGGIVKGFECINISNPGFLNQISKVCHFN